MNRPRFRHLAAITSIAILLVVVGAAGIARAQPTQEEVFKSMQQSLDKSEGSGPIGWIMLGGFAGLAVLGAASHYMQQRNRRLQLSGTKRGGGSGEGGQRTICNPNKLLREVKKAIGLSSAEVRQLKRLAAAMTTESGMPCSPLTLLLCPSVLARAVKAAPAKIDRDVLALLVRRSQAAAR